jgi:hypothetical protein
LPFVLEQGAKPLQGPDVPRSHGPLADLQDGGDLGVIEPLEVTHHQELLVTRRHRFECGPDPVSKFVA